MKSKIKMMMIMTHKNGNKWDSSLRILSKKINRSQNSCHFKGINTKIK